MSERASGDTRFPVDASGVRWHAHRFRAGNCSPRFEAIKYFDRPKGYRARRRFWAGAFVGDRTANLNWRLDGNAELYAARAGGRPTTSRFSHGYLQLRCNLLSRVNW